MRFDLPLTAFALESAGAAALALGEAHTLTLAARVADGAVAALPLPGEGTEPGAQGVHIATAAAQALTLTF